VALGFRPWSNDQMARHVRVCDERRAPQSGFAPPHLAETRAVADAASLGLSALADALARTE
jgi:hypothetical protein